MSIDPMAEKSPGFNPYCYCLNNPLVFVDPDGMKPRVFIETKEFGHAFITTGEGSELTIYTMGRTGDIPAFFKKSRKPGLALWGEGVLSILKGDDARNYLDERSRHGISYSIFEFEGDDVSIDEYYQRLFDNGTEPTGGVSLNKENSKVISTYVVFNNNCVTTTIKGLSVAGIDVTSERGTLLLSPAELISEIIKSQAFGNYYRGDDAKKFVKNLLREESD